MSIGANIKYVRKIRGLTQIQLAEMAHISRTYLADVEGDRYNPSVDTVTNLAKSLGVTVAVLLYEGDIRDLFQLSSSNIDSDSFLQQQKEEAPINDEGLKFALWGHTNVSDKALRDVRNYAAFIETREKEEEGEDTK